MHVWPRIVAAASSSLIRGAAFAFAAFDPTELSGLSVAREDAG